MVSSREKIVVAGHVCADIIPGMGGVNGGIDDIMIPGKLTQIGPALVSTGGTVANTGLAIHKLGIPVELMGKIGSDAFGGAVRQIFSGYGENLANGLIVSDSQGTSYTIVINPKGVDRIFLHHPGCNDTFQADDIDYTRLKDAVILHFGYPPLMRSFYSDGGENLEKLMFNSKRQGVTTSLDMAFVDPSSDAGKADWKAILNRCLPYVDIFLPSMDEILYMLDRDRFQKMQKACKDGDIASQINQKLLADISDELISMGAAVIAMKLGCHGLYLRTTTDVERLVNAGAAIMDEADNWVAKEMLTPCFDANVVGTTGSGDCTIAGFLTAIYKGLGPCDALNAAVATGACNVEAADATGGIIPWDKLQKRIDAGWSKMRVNIDLPDFMPFKKGVLAGPNNN